MLGVRRTALLRPAQNLLFLASGVSIGSDVWQREWMNMPRKPVLPIQRGESLELIGLYLGRKQSVQSELDRALPWLNELPASLVARAANEVAERAQLYVRYARRSHSLANSPCLIAE